MTCLSDNKLMRPFNFVQFDNRIQNSAGDRLRYPYPKTVPGLCSNSFLSPTSKTVSESQDKSNMNSSYAVRLTVLNVWFTNWAATCTIANSFTVHWWKKKKKGIQSPDHFHPNNKVIHILSQGPLLLHCSLFVLKFWVSQRFFALLAQVLSLNLRSNLDYTEQRCIDQATSLCS